MLLFNHTHNIADVIQHFVSSFASRKITEDFAETKWKLYNDTLSKYLERGIIMATSNQIKTSQVPMPWNLIRTDILGKNSKGAYYLDWFHTHYPLVKIQSKGSNLKEALTMITPLTDIELEIAAASDNPQEAFAQFYSDIQDDDQIDWIPMDKRSLIAYINSNKAAFDRAYRKKHLDTLTRNIIWAKNILMCGLHCEAMGEGFVLPNIVNESKFGRKYYRGLNLQNCPKIVRHAALGNCHSYDLNASVFAWLYHTAKQIDPTVAMPYTLEYLDLKSAIRKKLADSFELPRTTREFRIDLVKQVITAIGFGARGTNSGPFTSIADIIRNPEARVALLKDSWLKAFMAEQTTITNLIWSTYKDQLCTIPEVEHKKNKGISYLYQQTERQYLNALTEEANRIGQVLLECHDGFYTKNAVKLLHLREVLLELNPWATIGYDKIDSYIFDGDLESHRERMYDQELRARRFFLDKGEEVMFDEDQLRHKHELQINPRKVKHEYTIESFYRGHYAEPIDPNEL